MHSKICLNREKILSRERRRMVLIFVLVRAFRDVTLLILMVKRYKSLQIMALCARVCVQSPGGVL